MEQTAVDYLIKEVSAILGQLKTEPMQDLLLVDAINKAKEMEKQQIIDAFGVGCHLESKRLIGYHDVAEQHYNETYGSKGSDEEKTNSQRFDEFMQLVTSSQTEISDEEIVSLANEHVLYNDSKRQWVIEGMKLYREQFKKK